MKGKFQESKQLRKELWKHKEAAKNKELLKESHLKTLSELRKESEQSKHKELVDHLPSVGCKHCIKGDPPQPVAVHNLCVCEDLFLQPLANWRPAAKVWFARERRGNNWHQNVMKTISEEAKLSKIYTNGSIRASLVTELLAAGYDNRIIMELTGHKSHAMVQTYSRQLERMDSVEHRQANMLLNSSGRNALRGRENMFGELGQASGASKRIGENHRRAVQLRAGLESIAKVNLDQLVLVNLIFIPFIHNFTRFRLTSSSATAKRSESKSIPFDSLGTRMFLK